MEEREKWLAERRKGLGGTDISAIMGINPYRTPLEVYLDKKNLLPPKVETPQMRFGKLLEPVIAERYVEETGIEVAESGLIHHPTIPTIFVTPDRLAVKTGLGLEIKTSRYDTGWGNAGTDEIPPYYLMQALWYMVVLDNDECDVAALIGGSDFRIYHIRRDKELEKVLVGKAREWWEKHIVRDVQPDLDESEAARQYLLRKYPANVRALIEAPVHEDSAMAELAAWEKDIATSEKRAEAIRNELRSFIGDADGLVGESGMVTWKKTKDGKKTDWEGIAEHLLCNATSEKRKEIIAQFTTVKEGTRRFLFTPYNEKQLKEGK